MNCSRCQKPMIILEFQQVEMDHCLPCGGIWLDRGELDLLLEDPAASHKLFAAISSLSKTSEKKIPCPRCRTKMEKYLTGENSRSILDLCPLQHGIWFDRGELPSLLDQADTEESQKIAALLRNMFQHELSTPST